MLPLHVSPETHGVPHAPQLLTSVVVSTQVPPHGVLPPVHGPVSGRTAVSVGAESLVAVESEVLVLSVVDVLSVAAVLSPVDVLSVVLDESPLELDVSELPESSSPAAVSNEGDEPQATRSETEQPASARRR